MFHLYQLILHEPPGIYRLDRKVVFIAHSSFFRKILKSILCYNKTKWFIMRRLELDHYTKITFFNEIAYISRILHYFYKILIDSVIRFFKKAQLSDAKKKNCPYGFNVFTIFQNQMMVRFNLYYDTFFKKRTQYH